MAGSSSSSKFGSLFKSPTVEVFIGDATAPYFLHRDNLCSKSAYFRQALTSGFREAAQGQIRLRDSDYDSDPSSAKILEDAFPHFVDFIYNGMYRSDHSDGLRMRQIEQKLISDDTERRRLSRMLDEKAIIHAKVYVLADRLLMPELKVLAASKLQRNLDTSHQNSNPAYFVNPDRVKLTVKISPSALAEVIKLVYRNTYTSDSASGGSETVGGNSADINREDMLRLLRGEATPQRRADGDGKDQIRTMVSKYTASVISSVRRSEEVMRCFEEIPEFMRDVFAFVADAPR